MLFKPPSFMVMCGTVTKGVKSIYIPRREYNAGYEVAILTAYMGPYQTPEDALQSTISAGRLPDCHLVGQGFLDGYRTARHMHRL